MPTSKLSSTTLVPLGVVGAVFMSLLGVVRGFDGQESRNAAEIATLKVQVADVERRITVDEARIERTDDHFTRIVEDLAKIKERLGIVEAKTPAK
jgi:hypothetical protein